MAIKLPVNNVNVKSSRIALIMVLLTFQIILLVGTGVDVV